MLKYEICGVETGFDDQWTVEMARREFEQLSLDVPPNASGEDRKPMCLCDECYDIIIKKKPMTREFRELHLAWKKRMGYA